LQRRRNLAIAVTVLVSEYDDRRLLGWKLVERVVQIAPLRHVSGIRDRGRPAQATH
jgi:hypothetical protein